VLRSGSDGARVACHVGVVISGRVMMFVDNSIAVYDDFGGSFLFGDDFVDLVAGR
jgi:hypothetical protein